MWIEQACNMHVLLHALITFYCLLAPAHCLKIAAITSLPLTNHGDVQLVVGGVLECARACCSRSWCSMAGFRRRYVTCHLFPSTDGLVGQEGAVKDTVFFLREELECSVSWKISFYAVKIKVRTDNLRTLKIKTLYTRTCLNIEKRWGFLRNTSLRCNMFKNGMAIFKQTRDYICIFVLSKMLALSSNM